MKNGTAYLAERATLGCMLADPLCIESVSTILKPEMIGDIDCRKIFTEIIEQHRNHPGHVDVITVHAALKRKCVKRGDEISKDFIDSLLDSYQRTETAIYYAQAVKKVFRDCRAKADSKAILDASNDPDVSTKALAVMMRSAADATEGAGTLDSFDSARIPSVLELYQRDRLKLDYVIEGLVAGTVGILAGYGAVGKGMFSLALAIDVALGADESGRGQVTGIRSAQGLSRTAFLTLEDTTESMIERVQRLADVVVEKKLAGSIEAGTELFEQIDQQVHIASFFGRKSCTFLLQEGRGYVRNELFINYIKTKFCGFRLIVLDTFRKLAAGVDENDSAAASMVLQICDEIASSTGAAVICVHHLGKPSGSAKTGEAFPSIFSVRGSSAIVMDARWAAVYGVPVASMCPELSSDELKNRRVLDIAKVNNGVAGRVYFENVKGVPVALGGGDEVASLKVTLSPPAAVATNKKAVTKPAGAKQAKPVELDKNGLEINVPIEDYYSPETGYNKEKLLKMKW